MKKIFLSALFLLGVVSASVAQDYNFALGFRGGGVANGITAKYFLNTANAVEALVSVVDGVSLYGLYEHHIPVISEGFKMYYGAGGNIGDWEYGDNKKKFTIGIDGVIGLEYKIRSVPLAFSVDYKPAFNIIGHTGFGGWDDFGIAVKLAF